MAAPSRAISVRRCPRACRRANDLCLDEPRWLTTEGRRAICESTFDLAAPCDTLGERRSCHQQNVEFEAAKHGLFMCDWPQPEPLPCGLSYGC